MSQSKLDVLDLIAVSFYLSDIDIYKLKYVSKSFKDIQERMLINYNPIIISDNDNIELERLNMIRKFPNIQTICYDYNTINIKNCFDTILNPTFKNSIIKIFVETIDILDEPFIQNQLSEYNIHLYVYYYDDSKIRNKIIKGNFYTIKHNFTEFSINKNFDKDLLTLIDRYDFIKTIILNGHFNKFYDGNEFYIGTRQIQSMKIILKNIDKIKPDTFTFISENTKLQLENINLIFAQSIYTIGKFEYTQHQVKKMQCACFLGDKSNFKNIDKYVLTNDQFIKLKYNKQLNNIYVNTTIDKLKIYHNIIRKFYNPKPCFIKFHDNDDIDKIVNSLINNNYKHPIIINYPFEQKIKQDKLGAAWINDIRVFINFDLIRIENNKLRIMLNKILVYGYHQNNIEQNINIETTIENKIDYHNIRQEIYDSFDENDGYDFLFPFKRGFRLWKLNYIDKFEIGKNYSMLYV